MSGDEVLVVNFAALEQASVDIQHALDAITDQLAVLERDAAPLVATWDGEARRAYEVRQTRWRRAAGDLSMMLRDIKRALDESAIEYRDTERKNTSLFQ